MIKELRQVGSFHEAPILLVALNLANTEWIGLTYKNGLGYLAICFWSAAGGAQISTNQLLDEIANDVVTALGVGAPAEKQIALYDIQLKHPTGWDRWLGGIPRPLRDFFDETLHPKLRALLKTLR